MSLDETAGLRSMGQSIARELDHWAERDHSLARVRSHMKSGHTLPPRSSSRVRPWLIAGACSLAAAAAAAFLIVRSQDTLEARIAGNVVHANDWIAAPAQEPLAIDFNDATKIVLRPDSRARITELHRRGAHVVLESGQLDVAVTHRTGADWDMSFGPFHVHVTGTRFSASFSPDNQQIQIAMQDGSVVVSGCGLGAGERLAAGQSFTASCRDRNGGPQAHLSTTAKAGRLDADPAAPAPSLDGLPLAADDPLGSDAGALEGTAPLDRAPLAAQDLGRAGARGLAAAIETFRARARAGKYREALGALVQQGFDPFCAQASADDLALAGDAARLAADSTRAYRAYDALRRRFAGTPQAAAAAFSLGRLGFDQRRDYKNAARWFDTYLREDPSGPLAREALGRRMEALDRAGDVDGARGLANRYLAEYPTGPHARLARRLVPVTAAKE